MSYSINAVKETAMNYKTDRPAAENPIKVQDLTFRDGHQSIFATRMRTEDMLPVAEMMDQVGFHSMEVWGGATFDTMHRYLAEDPWERIRKLKKVIKKTPFSMLLRGQNLVGYRNYADDVVRAFVQRSCDNGIDIFRVFDALNDFRNFETALEIIKKNKKHFQGTICYSLTEPRMGGAVYNLDYYLGKAKELIALGADSIAIKDMAGIVSPYDAFKLVSALKQLTKIPIHFHTHFTSGMGDLTILKAIEAGVDVIDTCMAPFSYRTSHPAAEPLVVTLLGTNRDTGFDVKLLAEIDRKLEEVVPKYNHILDNTKLSVIDINVILHQTPGGMLSNMVEQLRGMNALDRLSEVFEMMPKVREQLGQVPLVTPTSQIVGVQTVNNVLFDKPGESFTHITEQVKDLCFGLYGRTPRPIDEAVRAKALKDYPRGQKPITCRPGDILEPELPKVEEEVKGLAKDLDDTLICALYPVTGKRFLEWKYGIKPIPPEAQAKTLDDVAKEKALVAKALKGELVEKPKKDVPPKPDNARAFDVYVDGEYFKVEVAGDGAQPMVTSVAAPRPVPVVAPAPAAPKSAPKPTAAPRAAAATAGEGMQTVPAPIPGMIVEYKKKPGEAVKEGETILILEAMKMYNNIEAPCNGVVHDIPFKAGDSVAKDDNLCTLQRN